MAINGGLRLAVARFMSRRDIEYLIRASLNQQTFVQVEEVREMLLDDSLQLIRVVEPHVLGRFGMLGKTKP